MLRTPSIFGPLNSGFVPFASGAPIDAAAEAETETAEIIARVSAPSRRSASSLSRSRRSAAWAPASSARIRIVEALVVAAVCGYFGFGLLSAALRPLIADARPHRQAGLSCSGGQRGRSRLR